VSKGKLIDPALMKDIPNVGVAESIVDSDSGVRYIPSLPGFLDDGIDGKICHSDHAWR
jgi:hypothetical protein